MDIKEEVNYFLGKLGEKHKELFIIALDEKGKLHIFKDGSCLEIMNQLNIKPDVKKPMS